MDLKEAMIKLLVVFGDRPFLGSDTLGIIPDNRLWQQVLASGYIRSSFNGNTITPKGLAFIRGEIDE